MSRRSACVRAFGRSSPVIPPPFSVSSCIGIKSRFSIILRWTILRLPLLTNRDIILARRVARGGNGRRYTAPTEVARGKPRGRRRTLHLGAPQPETPGTLPHEGRAPGTLLATHGAGRPGLLPSRRSQESRLAEPGAFFRYCR